MKKGNEKWKRLILNLSYIAIIGGDIIIEKNNSSAPWIDVIKSEFGMIIFFVFFIIIIEYIIKLIVS